jgi:hypothetical protein
LEGEPPVGVSHGWDLAIPAQRVLADDLDAVDLKQRDCGVAADLRVVVNFPQHGHRGPENVVLD